MSLTAPHDPAGTDRPATTPGAIAPPPPPPPRDHARPWLVLALATALAVIAALVVVLAWPEPDGTPTPPPTTPAPTTVPPKTVPPTTAAPTTAPPATVAPPAPVDTSTAVFPTAPGLRYRDPVAAARAFAVDFVGFSHPVVGTYRAGDARSGEVPVRAEATGPVTTVLVRQLGADGSWWVLGATTDTISVTAPAAGDAISPPVTVHGAARTWEGAVSVEIRQDGTRTPIGTGTVTGGGDVMRTFQGDIAFRTPTTPRGAVVFLARSARDGLVRQATVVRVAFDV